MRVESKGSCVPPINHHTLKSEVAHCSYALLVTVLQMNNRNFFAMNPEKQEKSMIKPVGSHITNLHLVLSIKRTTVLYDG